MSDLQLALLAFAGVLLAGLFAYGKWQERRTLRQFSADLRSGVGDALLAGGDADPSPRPPSWEAPPSTVRLARVEPQLTREPSDVGGPVPEAEVRTPGAAPAAAGGPAAVRREPTLPPALAASVRDRRGPSMGAPAPIAGAGGAAAAQAASHEWVEDPLLDFAVELRCAHAVDGVAVYDAATRLTPGLLPTPIHLVVWDARAQQWRRPDRFGFYSDVLVAAQLASRRHTLGEPELTRLVAAVQQVALALDADFDPPDVARVATQAAELDRLCSRFDVRIGLTLEPSQGTWTANQVADAAAAVDLVSTGALRWVRYDEAGRRMFTLAAPEARAASLQLELDVPIAPADADPLRQMFAAGLQMTEALVARVVDDNGRPIDGASLATIEAQLARLYGEMRAAGIEPAGLRAQRLYT
ncbi:MAG TPA: hypothetical protein VMU33_13240 [Burkholderiaceae bacterium]|nr:hypothetical protein [Burkholderiaceae bacterium]